MTVKKMKRRAILAFVQNKPGTLNKISMMIRRKMYNVDTLTVCKAKPPGVSRMTITLREDDEAKVCLLYTSPSPRDRTRSRMPSSA